MGDVRPANYESTSIFGILAEYLLSFRERKPEARQVQRRTLRPRTWTSQALDYPHALPELVAGRRSL